MATIQEKLGEVAKRRKLLVDVGESMQDLQRRWVDMGDRKAELNREECVLHNDTVAFVKLCKSAGVEPGEFTNGLNREMHGYILFETKQQGKGEAVA
jgi:hypothetical protein